MLTVHTPRRDEFVVRQRWLADPEMMSYNAGWPLSHAGYDPVSGCIDWPEAEWPAFESWLSAPVAERAYYYVRDPDAGFVGHVHYAVDGDCAAIGLNVVPVARGNGLGRHFLRLLLDRVWADTSAVATVNEFEDDRIAAVRLHRALGFVPDPGTGAAFGRPTRVWRLPRERADR